LALTPWAHNPKVGGSNPPPATKIPFLPFDYKHSGPDQLVLRILLLGVCWRLRLVVRVWQRHVGQGVEVTTPWRDLWELRTTMLNIVPGLDRRSTRITGRQSCIRSGGLAPAHEFRNTFAVEKQWRDNPQTIADSLRAKTALTIPVVRFRASSFGSTASTDLVPREMLRPSVLRVTTSSLSKPTECDFAQRLRGSADCRHVREWRSRRGYARSTQGTGSLEDQKSSETQLGTFTLLRSIPLDAQLPRDDNRFR